LSILALRRVNERQIVHGQQRDGMLRENPTPDLQDLCVETLGLSKLALKLIVECQIVHGVERIGMLRAQHAALDFQCLVE